MGEVEKKTVREWIETLPEYIRDRALANVRAQGMEEQLGVNVASLSAAIIITFGWRGTPEGKMFWNKVSNGKHPRIKRRFKCRERLAALERAVRELKEARVTEPQSSAHRSTPVPDADADHKARRIQSITEAYSAQPVTYVVVDKPSDKQSVKEIVLEDDWGFPTYCGYNFDGEPLFEYLADSVNVHYFPAEDSRPGDDAGPLTWRIRSLTSLNTKHPRTFTVEDKLNDKGSVKEIVLKKWIDGAVYEGYSFDGELVFRYGTEYATVQYFTD